MQLLEQEGIYIGAHIERIAAIADSRFDPLSLSPEQLSVPLQHGLTVRDEQAALAMAAAIEEVRRQGDSLGGVIECAAVGLPVGLGDPMFDGMENRIAAAVFAIPAVKGLEFGAGFSVAGLRGSENNDSFVMQDGAVRTLSNNHGGILGGISSGMPLIFRAAFKPTPSIFQPQQSISFSRQSNTTLQLQGRHDPCIVSRAVPCVEAAAALAIYDALLDYKKQR